jgi:hypothetical protein
VAIAESNYNFFEVPSLHLWEEVFKNIMAGYLGRRETSLFAIVSSHVYFNHLHNPYS